MAEADTVTLEAIQEANERISKVVRRTPLQPSRYLSELTEAQVYLKLENVQRTGSFKPRGAYNKISQLDPMAASRGLVAASAGNHAQGVALAASVQGYPSTIVMPFNAPLSKVQATRGYGASVVLEGLDYDEAYAAAKEIQEKTRGIYVHAFDDPHVVAGQGTIGLELLADLPELDAVVVPVGGGGLISGIAVALHSWRPDIRVIGVEASAAASVCESLSAGHPVKLRRASTIADGIAVKRPGDLTLELIRQHVDRVVTVDDAEIAHAVMLLLERNKLLVEGAGAVGVAALLTRKVEVHGSKVAVILSGGNIDLNMLAQVVARGLGAAGRYLRFFTRMPDRPGALAALLNLLADTEANVVSVDHERMRANVALGQTGVDILLETADRSHRERVLEQLAREGYEVEIVEVVPTQDPAG